MQFNFFRPRNVAAAGALLGAVLGAQAQELRIGFKAEVTSADPHVLGASNRGVWSNVYEGLVGQDESLRPVPRLAMSWKALDDRQWEFKLRPNVKFHNGAPLTAEDVKFSLDRAKALVGPRTFKTYLRQLESVRVVDPLTVVVQTRDIAPTLPENVGLVGIVPKGTGAEIKEEDFESGKAAHGTGAYKYAGLVHGQHVMLTGNDAHWGGKPAWSKVTYKFIPKEPARAAAILAGSVDVVDGAAGSLGETLREDKSLTVVSGTSYMYNHLQLDQFRAQSPQVTGNDGQPLAKNPFQDKRVRQAISLAINREAIKKFVMKGDSEPASQIVPAGFFGHDASIKATQADPQRAKALLAEAGYPQGFRTTLHCTNDRYLNDGKVCEAVAQMLTQAGIKTEARTLPYATFIKRATNGGANGEPEFSLAMFGTGAVLGNSLEPSNAVLHTYNKAAGTGANNYGRYSHKEFDATIQKAGKTVDSKAREELQKAAARIVAEDAGVIPIHNAKASWALRKGLSMTPRSDGFTMPNAIRSVAK